MPRSAYRSHILQPSQTKTILLLDESYFLYHRLSITKNTKTPYSRSEHKQLINQKIDEIQHQYGVKKEAISFATKNVTIQWKKANFFLWEVGDICFDIVFYILDEQRSDIYIRSHISVYPRRFFLLQHPLFADISQAALLDIQSHTSHLIQIRDWWYDQIHSLNGGDDLLRQAYEQAGIDPQSVDQIDISTNTVWGKLLEEAHTNFSQIVVKRLHSHLDSGKTLYLSSRLIDQPFFIHYLTDAYTKLIQGMLIPYRGDERFFGERSWSSDELPVLMALQSLMRSYS